MDFLASAGFTYTLTFGNTTGTPIVDALYYMDALYNYANTTQSLQLGPGPPCNVPVNVTIILPTAGGVLRLGNAVIARESVIYPSDEDDTSGQRIPPLPPILGFGPLDPTPDLKLILPTLPIIGR
jgi:hypothetical protein